MSTYPEKLELMVIDQLCATSLYKGMYVYVLCTISRYGALNLECILYLNRMKAGTELGCANKTAPQAQMTFER